MANNEKSDRVSWHEWDDATFKKAKEQDKPILLDVGASWCHWCQVMQAESYSDENYANFINENFIPVRVNRDERPDIDRRFQESVNLIAGQGGWPLTVFLTPEKKPFFGGTYWPAEEKWDLPSFMTVLTEVKRTWKEERDKVETATQKIIDAIKTINPKTSNKDSLNKDLFNEHIQDLLDRADEDNGGFGFEPKFPNTETLNLLLESNTKDASDFALFTLRKMASGGFHDHLGGGFHRYSVDKEWKIPHFEKLLIDNSLLLRAYAKAFKISKDPFFADIARGIITFLKDDLLNKENDLFYSSLDSDIKSKEGELFTWTIQEVTEVLGKHKADVVSAHYGLSFEGDLNGRCVLRKVKDLREVARESSEHPETVQNIILESRELLLKKRNKRKIGLDKNHFLGWNSIAVSALCEAYDSLGYNACLDLAINCYNSLMKQGVSKLSHSISGDKVFADDLTSLVEASLALFKSTQEYKYLDNATKVHSRLMDEFFDKDLLTDTPKKEEPLLSHLNPCLDITGPSANGVAANNALLLAEILSDSTYHNQATLILSKMIPHLHSFVNHASTAMSALHTYLNPAINVVIVGESNDLLQATKESRSRVNILLKNDKLPIFEGKGLKEGRPTAYIVKDNEHEAISEPLVLRRLLDE